MYYEDELKRFEPAERLEAISQALNTVVEEHGYLVVACYDEHKLEEIIPLFRCDHESIEQPCKVIGIATMDEAQRQWNRLMELLTVDPTSVFPVAEYEAHGYKFFYRCVTD